MYTRFKYPLFVPCISKKDIQPGSEHIFPYDWDWDELLFLTTEGNFVNIQNNMLDVNTILKHCFNVYESKKRAEEEIKKYPKVKGYEYVKIVKLEQKVWNTVEIKFDNFDFKSYKLYKFIKKIDKLNVIGVDGKKFILGYYNNEFYCMVFENKRILDFFLKMDNLQSQYNISNKDINEIFEITSLNVKFHANKKLNKYKKEQKYDDE